MEDRTGPKIISAERSLLAALAETDMRRAAALLRCAAKYLEGAADDAEGARRPKLITSVRALAMG